MGGRLKIKICYLRLLVENKGSGGNRSRIQPGHSSQEADKLVHIHALLQSHRVFPEKTKLVADSAGAGKFPQFLFFFFSGHVQTVSLIVEPLL